MAMRDMQILKTALENSSLGKSLGSNEVQTAVFGAQIVAGAGYDITRVRSWSNEVSKAVHELFCKWYEQGIRWEKRTAAEQEECFKKIQEIVQNSSLCKKLIEANGGKPYPKDHPLERFLWWIDEVAQQSDNAYRIWVMMKDMHDQKKASAKIKTAAANA